MSHSFEQIVIRPSSTTQYPDCERRTAARYYPDIVEAVTGIRVRELVPNAAAAVGTAAHVAVNHILRAKLDIGELDPKLEAEDKAIMDFRRAAEAGMRWDDTTRVPNDAEKQLISLAGSYRQHRAPTITPVALESRKEVDLGGGFIASGAGDVVAIQPESVNDYKTGVVERMHHAQLGFYSRIYRAHDYNIKKIEVDFHMRVRPGKAQPPPVTTKYDVGLAEQIVEARIKKMKRDLAGFLRTGNIQNFSANPSSMLCSEKWCCAWGTRFCREHKGA